MPRRIATLYIVHPFLLGQGQQRRSVELRTIHLVAVHHGHNVNQVPVVRELECDRVQLRDTRARPLVLERLNLGIAKRRPTHGPPLPPTPNPAQRQTLRYVRALPGHQTPLRIPPGMSTPWTQPSAVL